MSTNQTLTNIIPKAELKKGDRVEGFVVDDVVTIPDVCSVAYLLTHKKSGAKMLHLHNSDPENLMAIGFRTPPFDETGVFHILEHGVLAGSEKYPIKNVFFQMVKTSMATFINALTYQDKTVYPYASMNEKDFYNLASVYVDCIFHPRLTENTFKQEGHHLELINQGDLKSPLIIKGVVYNEMKGAMSGLDQIIIRHTGRDVFENAYKFESGGDPDHIPDLTYEQFKKTYQKHYHPSNALIFTYGNLPTRKHLHFLSPHLNRFDKKIIHTSIAAQKRWAEPKIKQIPYAIDSNENPDGKYAVNVTYFVNEITDAHKTLAMKIFEYYLLGNAASPLKRTLIDSQLGTDLSISGYDDSQRETLFTVGLKGVKKENVAKVPETIFGVLKQVASGGLDADKIDSAFHHLELYYKNIDSHYPITLMERIYQTWLYSFDPLYYLRVNSHLEALKAKHQQDPSYLINLFTKLLLDNRHHLTHVFKPDSKLQQKKDKMLTQKLKSLRSSMSPNEIKTIKHDADKLQASQATDDSPDALSTLPTLTILDVSKKTLELDTEVLPVSNTHLLTTQMYTNGLSYLTLSFNLSTLPDELIDYLPLYSEVFRKMGAGKRDYLQLAELEASTGTIGASVHISGTYTNPLDTKIRFNISSISLDEKFADISSILVDKINLLDLSNQKRLREIVLQFQESFESNLIPYGHRFATLSAAKNINRTNSLLERTSGIYQLQLLKSIVNNYKLMQNNLVNVLTKINRFLLVKSFVTGSFIGNPDNQEKAARLVLSLSSKLNSKLSRTPLKSQFLSHVTVMGIIVPTQVAFNALAIPSVSSTHPLSAAVEMLGHALSLSYLSKCIREQGGAYGSGVIPSPLNGAIKFYSYRDPHIIKTLDIFKTITNHLDSDFDFAKASIEASIIGTLKNIDIPFRPSMAVNIALNDFLLGSTRQMRQINRNRLLSVTAKEIKWVNQAILKPALNQASIGIVANRQMLEEANKTLKPQLDLIAL